MAPHLLQRTLTALALLTTTLAQDIIPQDLTTGFNKKEVQVSYTNKAAEGFASGTTFSRDAVGNEPTFALGDSNGISPSTRYTLIMVDTTCPNRRTLHYARSNFKFSFAGGTNIETEAAPLLDYKAPGAFGEQGDARQYVFLMYTNPQRREIAELQLPGEGEAFDVKQFQADNQLKDPVAGVGMLVQLGGTADCGGEEANPLPGGLPTAAPSVAPSAAPSAVPTTGQGAVSSVVGSSATAPVQTANPSASVPVATTTLPGGDQEQGAVPTNVTSTRVPAVSSGGLQTDDTVPTSAASIPSFTSVPAPGAGSPTTSSGPLEQTANAAPEAFKGERRMFGAQLFLVAGVLLW